jgi:uncharacterized zinc-type alcohol dehydrogenase-like protein
MVPGHEIVGQVSRIGTQVQRFALGDAAGVGCFVDSCRRCPGCVDGLEQYCENHLALTYNGTEMDTTTPTRGGYSTQIVVDERYALKIPRGLELAGVAPLLCAGITTWSPLKTWQLSAGQRLGVVGLGGLGHMAVKFGAAFGAEVTVISTSPKKAADARRLGAHDFVVSRDDAAMARVANSLDLLIDTVSAPHDINALLELLKRDGTMILVGASPEALPLHAFPLLLRRRRLVGSLIGGIRETQEMLDYCGEKGIVSDVEVIAASQINEAWERTVRGDVRYRFSIDCSTF